MTTPGIPNDYVLSTACFGTRLATIQDQIFAAVGMGFRRLELGLSKSPATMEGLEESRRETGVTLGSIVAGARDPSTSELSANRLGSADPTERERAMNAVRRHARLAQSWGCSMIVVRGSQLEDAALSATAEKLEAELLEHPEDEQLHERATALVSEVARKGQRQVEALCRSLHSLMQEVPGMRFAIEPGSRLDDLLGFEAMGWVLDDLSAAGLGYWHDVSFIHAREAMGLPKQGDWLEAFAPKMLGIHLQDAAPGEDDMPLGLGCVDFKLVVDYVPKEAERVLEMNPRHGRAEILSSVQFLVDHGF